MLKRAGARLRLRKKEVTWSLGLRICELEAGLSYFGCGAVRGTEEGCGGQRGIRRRQVPEIGDRQARKNGELPLAPLKTRLIGCFSI